MFIVVSCTDIDWFACLFVFALYGLRICLLSRIGLSSLKAAVVSNKD